MLRTVPADICLCIESWDCSRTRFTSMGARPKLEDTQRSVRCREGGRVGGGGGGVVRVQSCGCDLCMGYGLG